MNKDLAGPKETLRSKPKGSLHVGKVTHVVKLEMIAHSSSLSGGTSWNRARDLSGFNRALLPTELRCRVEIETEFFCFRFRVYKDDRNIDGRGGFQYRKKQFLGHRIYHALYDDRDVSIVPPRCDLDVGNSPRFKSMSGAKNI